MTDATNAQSGASASIVLYVHGIGGSVAPASKGAMAATAAKKQSRRNFALEIAKKHKWPATEYIESAWGASTPVLDLSRKALAARRGVDLPAPASLGVEEDGDTPDFPEDYSEGAAGDLLRTVAEEPWLLDALGWDAANAVKLAQEMASPYLVTLQEVLERGAPAIELPDVPELAHLGPKLAALSKFPERGPARAHDLKNAWRYTIGSRGAAKILNVGARRLVHRHMQANLADLLRYASSNGADRTAPFLIVCNEILEAAEKIRGGPPNSRRLVLFGHSLGGVLLYDVLTAAQDDVADSAPEPLRRLARLRDDVENLHVTLVTAGAQVAVFESLDALKGRQFARAPRNDAFLDRPKLADKWINVYDPKDVLGFGVGNDEVDRTYETNRLYAHDSYFGEKRFSEWLGGQIS